jgi:hypothetical protein
MFNDFVEGAAHRWPEADVAWMAGQWGRRDAQRLVDMCNVSNETEMSG